MLDLTQLNDLILVHHGPESHLEQRRIAWDYEDHGSHDTERCCAYFSSAQFYNREARIYSPVHLLAKHRS